MVDISEATSNTKDHVFVSPELAMYLENVLIADTYFKDHAALAARFTSLGKPPILPMWKQPHPMDWKEVPDIRDFPIDFHPSGNADEKYHQIFRTLEKCVDQKLCESKKPPLLSKQKGRAATLEVHMQAEFAQPPKAARMGERQPSFHGVDPTHCRWMRQSRRLSNLAKNLCKANRTTQQQQHANQVWNSIVQAAGFAPHFVGWWNDKCGDQATLTLQMPTAKIASAVAKGFDSQ